MGSMESQGKSLAIVGGGAAGLAAAIAAGDCARKRGSSLSIAVYERDDRVGRSILATGNGRCNFSNAAIDAGRYRNSAFVAETLAALEQLSGSDDAVHGLFRSLGLVWREEADGRQYPLANKATAVLDVLRAGCAAHGVLEACDSDVAAVDGPRKPGGPFTLRMANGVLKRADAVIIACGGRTLSALDAGAIPRVASKPVLGPLAVSERDRMITRELDNIRVKGRVSLLRDGEAQPVAVEDGELMFRKYGLSGICVFDLSRFARPGDRIAVNFLGTCTEDDACGVLAARYDRLLGRYGPLTYGDLLRGLLLPRVAEAVVKSSFINPFNYVEPEAIPSLARLLTAFTLEVEGIADAGLCQVRRGGIAVEALDPATMQVEDLPGLYACGEALDVDGPCGGYNLHWAWASGLVAGIRAAALLSDCDR